MLHTSAVRLNEHISDIKRAVNHASVGFFNTCVEALVTLTAALNQTLVYRSSPYMMNADMAVNMVPMQAPGCVIVHCLNFPRVLNRSC